MSTAAEGDQGTGFTWPEPPPGGWTADDLDRIPGLPAHTEMIDGGLFFVSPQTHFHMATLWLLEYGLRTQVPEEFYVVREMTTRLGERDRPEPDLMVVPRRARKGPEQTSYEPADVRLAIEVVSQESVERDRTAKPQKYARAGIEHFWRVERNGEEPVVYVYELEPASGTYVITGIHHHQLKVAVPFPIEMELTLD
ncbi:Uma2 family endonuclease [Streptomyces sp. NPDC088194]|uniref:Uma2 family endonuclease n=1 Tax=Streptomyces sp. NPDC088194 TaxID=3154931 RepID=UPI00344E42C4